MIDMIAYAEELGKKRGRREARREAIKEGETRLCALAKILLKNKRYSDLEKAAEDEKYREELYKKYGL